MSVFKNKFVYFIALVAILGMIVSSISGSNPISKIANATVVNACGTGEILEGSNCVFTKVSNSQFETKCVAGYIIMDSVCAKFNTQACAYFKQALDAENGMCKLDLSSPVYGTEINDNDGRQCNGIGTNFKRYSVGLPNNSTSGPVVCGNNFSLLDKTTFRFLPRVITEISNLTSIQTQNIYSSCPAGYLEVAQNKCSRPATAQSCNSGGEIFVNNNCMPCPAGQYCPGDGVITKLATVCANGGTLNNNQCIAPIKYSTITYVDGCAGEYTKKDQSCAIVETRTHDLACSYFYTSENVNITATLGLDGYCSTGGRADFASASIVRVSDFNCNGAGTYYYNYNVAYDPLVCGNDYNVVGKTGFKWLPDTFTKITALQKIPNTVLVCPTGWTSFDNSNNCSQAPITQEFRNPVECPINTYCPGSNTNPIPCPVGTTSQSRSTKLSDCVFAACNNGTLNPPACNQCREGLQPIDNTCLLVCPSGVNRDSYNNCAICTNGAVNPSSGCNACRSGYVFNGSNCVLISNIICKHGFEQVSNNCVCLSPKITINKFVRSGTSETFCENLPSSSSSSAVSSISSSSSVVSSIVLPVSISGYVYVDANNNGNFESSESSISGVTMTLRGTQDPCKNVNLSTTTASNGYYQFSNLVPCTYSVTETQPSNYNNGTTTIGTVNGFKVGTLNVNDSVDNITLNAGQNSINNNFGEVLINLPITNNNSGAIIINNNNNNPTTNNNNSVNNNVVNNYQAAATIAQPAPKPNFIPMATPINPVTYYQSPVANVTETIRSGGFNIVIIISTLIASASFVLIYLRGKRNQRFGNYTFKNNIGK